MGQSATIPRRIATGLFLIVLALACLAGPRPVTALVALPPDPFDATDRYAILTLDAAGQGISLTAKVNAPDPAGLGKGDLIALLRYRLPGAGPPGQSSPFRQVTSRPVPVEGLSGTAPAVLTLDFAPTPLPAAAFDRTAKLIFRSKPPATGPPVVLDLATIPSERILSGGAAAALQSGLPPSPPGSLVFGPATFLRERGAPQTDTATFNLTNISGPFLVQVANGDAAGNHRVSSAVITLNGDQVFRPSDFNHQVALVERQITLQASNQLSVELRSAPGAFLTLQVVRLHQRACRAFGPRKFTRSTGKPVTETATFPRDAQLVGPFTLKLVNGDPAGGHRVSSAVATLNGQALLAPNELNQQVGQIVKTVALQPSNALAVELRSAPGSFLSLEVTGFDATPPRVRITSPADEANLTDRTVAVAGTVDDPAARVTVNGIAATVHNGTFTATVLLADGPNTIAAVATDGCGNEGRDEIRVTVGVRPPQVTLCADLFFDAPPDPDQPCRKELAIPEIVGTAFGFVDDPKAALAINGAPVENLDGFFFAFVDLPVEGANPFTVVATNAAALQATDAVTFIRDLVPPTVAVTSPLPGSATRSCAIRIAGTVSDPTIAEVQMNFGPLLPVADETFAKDATLAEGQNFFIFSAMDQAGHLGVEVVSLTCDTTAPLVKITLPADGAILTTPIISASGTVNDATATVDVNGIAAALPAEGGFVANGVQLGPGPNLLTATGVDPVGNRATDSITVFLDLPPAIKITSPLPGALFTAQPITVSGAVSPDAVSVTVNGLPAAISGGTFTASGIPLVEGSNVLTAVATDVVGSMARDEIRVILDLPPTVRITSPRDGTVVTGQPVTVTGTVSPDAIAVTVNGVAASLSAGGGFTATNVPLVEGTNTLVATAADAVGSLARDQVQVILDLPPTVKVTSPADGAVLTAQPIAVSGTVSADATSVVVNGIAADVAAGTFTAQNVPLSLGPNTLRATAMDAVGSAASDQVVVTLQAPAPAKLIANLCFTFQEVQGGEVPTITNLESACQLDAQGNPNPDFDRFQQTLFDRRHQVVQVNAFVTTTLPVEVSIAGVAADPQPDGSLGQRIDLKTEASGFNFPSGVAPIGGLLFVSDAGSHQILRFDPSAGTLETLAGAEGLPGTDDGVGAAARFNFPKGITTDGASLYVSDSANHTIRRIVVATGAVTTLAGAPGQAGFADGTGGEARFNFPTGITTDGTNLYVADGLNHVIRRIVIATGAVTTLAGQPETAGFADGTGGDALFNDPNGVVTDGVNVYVADTLNQLIRRVAIATGAVTTLAGTPGQFGFADGPGLSAKFSFPQDLTTDGRNLYVADNVNAVIRKVDLAAGTVSTLAGSPGNSGTADGVGANATFDGLVAISTDGTNLFVTDEVNNLIRRMAIATRLVETLLVKGPALVDVTATADGQSVTETLTFNVDLTPPRVAIASPADGSLFVAPDQVLAGSVDDPNIGTITWRQNNLPAQTAPLVGQAFSIPVVLSAGLNTFTVTVQDPSGNFGGAGSTVRLVPATAGTIVGTVSNASTGLGLFDAQVLLETAGGVLQASTDNGGRYLLTQVPPGDFSGRIEKGGFVFRPIPPGTIASGEILNFDAALSLAPPPGVVLAGAAAVNVEPTSATITWTTNVPADSQLLFGTGLSPDQPTPLDPTLTTAHRIDLAGLIPDTQYFLLLLSADAAGKVGALRPGFFRTEPTPTTGTVTGTITNAATGFPVPGAAIFITAGGGIFPGLSGLLGLYTVAGLPPGPISIQASADGFATTTIGTAIGTGETLQQNIPLTPVPVGTLAGTITDRATGAPLEGALVTVTDAAGKTRSAASAPDGRYLLGNLAPGPFVGRVDRLGFFSLSFSGSISEGQTLAVDARLFPAPNIASVVGVVVDDGGQPIGGAQVTAADSVTTFTQTAGPDGRYRFDSLAPGDVTLIASQVGFLAAGFLAALAPGQVLPHTFVLFPSPPPPPTTGRLTGAVRDAATGQALPGATVAVADAAGAPRATTSGPDGGYILAGLAAGSFSGTAALAGFLTGAFAGTVGAGETLPLDLSLQPITTGTLAGTVTDERTSGPLAGVQVIATDATGTTRTATTGPDGAFAILEVPGGPISVSLTKAGFGSQTFTGTIVPRETLTLDAALGLPPLALGPVVATAVTPTSATIVWQTSDVADSTVRFGRAPALDQSKAEAALVLDHRITLTGLAPGTAYAFQVQSTSGLGQTATSEVQSFTTGAALSITIDSPADGTVTSEGVVTLRGRIQGLTEETGVTLDGFLAHVAGDRFAVPNVPIADGPNLLTIRATDATGQATTVQLTLIGATPAPPALILSAAPVTGAAPLRVRFHATARLVQPIATFELDFDGDGNPDFIGPSLQGVVATYPAEGLFFPTLTVTDAGGNRGTARTVVSALSRDRVDGLARAKWTAMRDALRAGDIEGALGFFKAGVRGAYRQQFTALAARLGTIADGLGDLQLVAVIGHQLIYDLRVNDRGTELSFQLRFEKDGDGIWRIAHF